MSGVDRDDRGPARRLSALAAHTFKARVAAADYAAIIQAVPFAYFLGLQIVDDGPERRYVMPYRDAHIGNATKPALHGGTVAGVLEIAMQVETLISQTQPRLPDPVDFTIDYWRSAGAADCHVVARVIRAGRSIAQAQAECWQADRERPVAFARCAFVLRAAAADAPDSD